MSLNWTSAEEKWEGRFHVKNISDLRYKTISFDDSAFTGNTIMGVGTPRWIGFSVKYNL